MIKTLRRTMLTLTAASMLATVWAPAATADPLTLDEAALDRVAAGYLSINAHAMANAFGDETLAVSHVHTQVSPGQRNARYAYTLGRASAFALAAGDRVSTDVGALYDTDEEVVRSRLRIRQRTRGNGAAVAHRFGISVPNGSGYERMEVQQLTFSIVTRVRRR